MKLIAQVKLQPTKKQALVLKQTLEVANAAANFVSQAAWTNKSFKQFDLHKLTYYAIREQFKLSAQMAVRTISKVADAYKADGYIGDKNRLSTTATQRDFNPLGSIAYDDRILTWKIDKSIVSLWTTEGRIKFSFVAGQRQLEMLTHRQGEADLIYRNGDYYVYQTCQIDEQAVGEVNDFLGVDMGVANIAVDSDGVIHQGKTVKNVRYRHRQLRRKLQAKGTQSSRRRLKKLSGKEKRFATWTNHNISKEIVEKAKDTGRGIAIEELGGIRDRLTVRKAQRSTLSSWSFAQLRVFIEYKAKLAAVPVVAVDPRNTSRTCPCCGYIDKANRKSQSKFLCLDCGYSGLADQIAAVNIRSRANVNLPYIPTLLSIPAQRQG